MSTANFCNQKEFRLMVKEVSDEFEYEDLIYGYDGFKDVMEEFNDSLKFFTIQFKSGYYSGVQLYVECDCSPYDLDNEYCRYYFDECRSKCIRKYDSEIKKINKWLKGTDSYGWSEIICLGIFSNGEAIYKYA